MKSVEIQKVHVNQDNNATLVCPHCGRTRTVSMAKLKGRKDPLKLRCTCQSVFLISLEFRKAYRKEVNLDGYYVKLSENRKGGKMVVRNISRMGLGFATPTSISHDLDKGDELRLTFELDDGRRYEIEQTVVVRWVKDMYIGCAFTNLTQYNKKNLGRYLMRYVCFQTVLDNTDRQGEVHDCA